MLAAVSGAGHAPTATPVSGKSTTHPPPAQTLASGKSHTQYTFLFFKCQKEIETATSKITTRFLIFKES